MHNAKVFFLTFLVVAFCGIFVSAYAQENNEKITYVPATFQNYSKTYWRLNKFDINDIKAVDNYMLINECELFREYSHNEFEWKNIREATQKYLEKNRQQFPIHYRFVQPISLGEYDFKKKGFWIAKEHQLLSATAFDMPSDQEHLRTCFETVDKVHNYPKSLALELTRPFTFRFFPYDEDRAQALINERMKNFENLKDYQRQRNVYLDMREVYMVTDVKMFAYKEGNVNAGGGTVGDYAKILGIMENMEIYGDRDLTDKMYSKDFRRQKKSTKKDF